MKRYFVKVYKQNGDYVTTWNDAKFYSFKQTINGGLGQIQLDLARKFDDFGEDNDVALNNEIQLWVSDDDSGSTGQKIYSGYISAYAPFIDGSNEGIKVYALGYITKLKKSWLKGTSTTSFAKTSVDVAQIVADIIDNYRAGTGNPSGVTFTPRVNYSWGSGGSIPATTGNIISYTFALDTHFDAIERMRRFAPADWWYYLGADNLLQFKKKNTQANHTFVFGKDFTKIEVFKNMENILNHIYFWNGLQDTDTNIIKSQYSNVASINDYDQSWIRKTDGRVKTQDTADSLSNALLAEKKDPEIRIVVEILDNNGEDDGYDIESIQVGDTVNFRGFNPTTSSLFNDKAIISGLTYYPEKVTLEIESLQTSLGRSVDEIELALEELQNTESTNLS